MCAQYSSCYQKSADCALYYAMLLSEDTYKTHNGK